MKRPCPECPFRKDTPPGQFSCSRYAALRETAGGPGREIPLGGPVFACHITPDGKEHACAGWLASCGYDHITIRLAISQKQLPASVLRPQPGWPELYPDYASMAAAQGAEKGWEM
jgi:hypothetical protein